MGLLSNVIAYNIGKRRQRRKSSRENAEPSFEQQHRSEQCIDFYYCQARGICDSECTYE